MAKAAAAKRKKPLSTKAKKKPLRTRKVAAKKKSTKKPAKRAAKSSATKQKKKVLSQPKGYNCVTPYLILDNASRAIEFYKKVFGAKEKMRMDKPGGKIGHAEINIGDSKIMLADEFPEMGARNPKSFGGCAVSIHLYVKNVDDVVKKAMDAGSKLLMPVSNMFYGDRSGSIEDPFGHRWYVSTHIEDVTPATMKKRAAQLYAQKHQA